LVDLLSVVQPVPQEVAENGDFWERAISLGVYVRKYAYDLLAHVASYYHLDDSIAFFEGTINQLVYNAKVFRLAVEDAAQKQGINLDEISEMFAILMADILEEMKTSFPPPDRTPSHEERKRLVSDVMTKVEDGIVRSGERIGMSEESLRSHMRGIRPHIEQLVVVTGALKCLSSIRL
jgi:hypothetical protein